MGKAIFAALLAAQAAMVSPALAAPGEDGFSASCAACHQPNGKGIPGAFPALAGDPFVQGPADQVIATVLDGRGGMPAFKGDLDDVGLAAIITYIRSSWGNTGAPVTATDIAAIRSGGSAAPPKKITDH